MQEIVCRYEKGEAVKYISHLDLVRAMQRACRRARIPLAFTQGRHPRPKVAYASALGVGATGEAEIMVLGLEEPLDTEVVQDAMNACLPHGLRILSTWTSPAYKRKFSVGELDTSDFRVAIRGPIDGEELRERVAALQSRASIIYTRKREDKTRDLDLRRFLSEIGVETVEQGNAVLRLRLRAMPGGSASPLEIMDALGYPPGQFRIEPHRTALFSSGAVGRPARRRVRKMLPRGKDEH